MVILSLLYNNKGSQFNLYNRIYLYKHRPIPLFNAFGISSRSSNRIVPYYSNSILYSLTTPIGEYPWFGKFSISPPYGIYSFGRHNHSLARVRLRFICELCTQYSSKDSNIIGYILYRLDGWLDISCQNIPFPCYILDKSCWYR